MFRKYQVVMPIESYVCPICKEKYATYSDANECINSHETPESIESYGGYSSHYNCPATVEIMLSNGEIAVYNLCGMANEKEDEDGNIVSTDE